MANNNTRASIPPEIQARVLTRGLRRCPLCYFLNGNKDERIGQIAHLDKDRSNASEDNLAWLCIEHHSIYDSTTRQHKNYSIREVKDLRNRLYQLVADVKIHASRAGGGSGGGATVGGNGIAIGGNGGRGGSGGGRGGDGGSAWVNGDGIAAGGEGGSVESENLWPPPARSGYETMMEQMGQPIDPKMREFGRGGMSGGYYERFQIVEKIREEFFIANGIPTIPAIEDVAAVPIEYVNERLEIDGYDWRARTIKLDYEFYRN